LDDHGLSTSELPLHLAPQGVTDKTLARWIRKGLPFTKYKNRRRFDPALVRQWLLQNTPAELQTVVATQDEVAALEGVHVRTVAHWLAQGCPGRPGRYDLSQIRQWRADHLRRPSRETTAKDRYEHARAEQKELQVGQLRGELVHIDELRDLLATVSGPLLRLRDDLIGTAVETHALRSIDEIINQCHTIAERNQTDEIPP